MVYETTIKVSKEFRNRLTSLKKPNETYQEFLETQVGVKRAN